MTSPEPSAQIPYGLADLQGGFLYIEGADRHLECLDIVSGEVLARTEFPGRALAMSEGHIIGWSIGTPQPHTLNLFKVRRRGAVLSPVWQQTIDLPDWVDILSSEREAFTLCADVGDEVVITWEAHSRYNGGASPSSRVEIAQTHDECRLIRIDIDSGEIVSEEPGEFEPEQIDYVVKALPLVPYRSSGLWVNRPWRVGPREALLLRASDTPGIVLRHRDLFGAATEADIPLTTDAATESAVTPDGSLILAHEPDLAPGDWKVFSSETGEQIASLPYENGTEGVAVIGPRVLYVVTESQEESPMGRRFLRCRDLESGALRWSHLLSETQLRPPPPPRP